MKPKLVSFVIPVMNEEKTIRTLYFRISAAMSRLGIEHQVIFIDDGSQDTSWDEISYLANKQPQQVIGIQFRSNQGKANALAVGFKKATGDLVFTMDADLQDDPKEISRFVSKIEDGYDVVSGWKQQRYDPWHKVLPSRVFNRMLSNLSGVQLHDHNCGFKCYRAAVVKDVRLYGEMHRMIPSLGKIHGYRSTEIIVQHHPRLHGVSKYGVKRFLRGFMDMWTIYFLRNFRERPSHCLGAMAMTLALLGTFFLFSGFVFGTVYLAMLGTAFWASVIPLVGIGWSMELFLHYRMKNHWEMPISKEIESQAPVLGIEDEHLLDYNLPSNDTVFQIKEVDKSKTPVFSGMLKQQIDLSGIRRGN
ncbi:MAG: glycosyltransferase family 2 protein [Verrucomicrobiota bacterium]